MLVGVWWLSLIQVRAHSLGVCALPSCDTSPFVLSVRLLMGFSIISVLELFQIVRCSGHSRVWVLASRCKCGLNGKIGGAGTGRSQDTSRFTFSRYRRTDFRGTCVKPPSHRQCRRIALHLCPRLHSLQKEPLLRPLFSEIVLRVRMVPSPPRAALAHAAGLGVQCPPDLRGVPLEVQTPTVCGVGLGWWGGALGS